MINPNKHISVVSPVYFGEQIIIQFVARLHKVLRQITPYYEIILVDDGSPDRSWQIISELCKSDAHLVGVRFNKNYGQHAAIKAGLRISTGNWIVVMDCDLQDPPEEITNLYAAINDSTDAVMALRQKNWQPQLKRFYSALFYKSLSLFTGKYFHSNTANFGIYSRQAIEQSTHNDLIYFFFPLALKRATTNIQYLKVQFDPNRERTTAYSLSKAFRLAFTILKAQLIFASKRDRKTQDYVISEVIKMN